jgi:hypothetical protein
VSEPTQLTASKIRDAIAILEANSDPEAFRVVYFPNYEKYVNSCEMVGIEPSSRDSFEADKGVFLCFLARQSKPIPCDK